MKAPKVLFLRTYNEPSLTNCLNLAHYCSYSLTYIQTTVKQWWNISAPRTPNRSLPFSLCFSLLGLVMKLHIRSSLVPCLLKDWGYLKSGAAKMPNRQIAWRDAVFCFTFCSRWSSFWRFFMCNAVYYTELCVVNTPSYYIVLASG